MKCSEIEKLILLKDSGELTGTPTHRLSSHLNTCENCQQFSELLTQSKKTFQPLEEPPVAVVNEIKREARRLAPKKRQPLILYRKPVFALAASVLIGLGIFFSHVTPNRDGLEIVLTETELLDPQDQAIDIMYGGLSDDDLAFNFLMTYEDNNEG